MNSLKLSVAARFAPATYKWQARHALQAQSVAQAHSALLDLSNSLHVLEHAGGVVLEAGGSLHADGSTACLGVVPACSPESFGDPTFLRDYGVRFAYYAGAMAGGIASEEMVIALGSRLILSSFGAGGLSVERVRSAIRRIKEALPNGHMPSIYCTTRANPIGKWLASNSLLSKT